MKRKLIGFIAVCVALISMLTGCGDALENMEKINTALPLEPADNYRTSYEVFVYSFCDSDGDGVGDIQGLISKLDYINDGDATTNTDLGCSAIWLMPVMPSTTYHKYDVTDYKDIDPEYGSLNDFDELIEQCHNRNIDVYIDLVMNHSSSKHEWFKNAVKYLQELPENDMPDSKDCPYIDYYNFREGPAQGYAQVPATGTRWYYEAQFWSEMPDLNLSCELVRDEFDEITTFWLDRGVDGFRLDAVKEFTSGDTNANVEVLTWFTDMVKAKKPDCYIVGECWTGMDMYAQYYDSGMDSLFDFAFSDSQGIIATSVNKGNADRYASNIVTLQDTLSAHNSNYIDAPFYTNHDQGRSAGYYTGDNALAKTKMAQALNLMMSGNAFLYYGEELGMKGAGKDENKRAPMYWTSVADAEGMCKGPRDMEHVEMKYQAYDEQCKDPDSIYNFVKQAIKLRNAYPQISHGYTTYYEELSTKSLAVLGKEYDGETVYLLINLGDEKATVDMSTIVPECGKGNLVGALLTGKDAPRARAGRITVPAYGIAVIR